MRYRILRFSVLALLLLNGFLFGSANLVEAQSSLNARLDGTYSFHLSRHCNRETAGDGFNANLQFDTSSGLAGIGIEVHGTITFNGSGSASATTTEVITLPNAIGQVFGNQQTCTFTYVVSSDGSFTLQGSCSGTQTAGPNIGATLSTTGIKLKGQIGTRRRTLIFFGDGTDVETFNGGADRQQICSQTGTAVRAS